MPAIAAVVATHNRPRFLAERSLASIALQTRPPDFLVVVDDSDPQTRRTNHEILAEFRAAGTETFYLENRRTPGAAGSWNSALSHLQDTNPSTFVAILDDDDSWEQTYLEQCEKAVLERDLDMVAAGIVFHKSRTQKSILLDPPARLDVTDLLVRNPHIQGSNLFVRLRRILEAGGFDEALASTTDRDICIRLADLGAVEYGVVSEHLVNHHADNDRPRLSTPGGDAKRAGLGYFYRKYRGRMSGEQQTAFIGRSRDLFDCDLTPEPPSFPPAAPVPDQPNVDGHLHLVVGAVTSPEVDRVANLMDSLAHKIHSRNDVTLKVVLLENGWHEPASRDSLRESVSQASRQGLDVDVKTLEQQVEDMNAGVFSAEKEQLSRRKSIALSRTMLQHYLFLEAKPRLGSVVWILDDDLVLEGLGYGPNGFVQNQGVDYVSAIQQLKETGAGVVLCEVTGDPPLPVLSCIRTQLVDLYHNLHRLASMEPDAPFPGLQDENRLARVNRRDYYYDLSTAGTDHLELPFRYEPSDNRLCVGQVFEEMVPLLPGMLSGKQVFRPLTRVESGDSVSAAFPSINRGPATLVFDLQALREFPNAVPAIDGADTRRSDMVWSLLNRFVGGREIVQAPLPVRQVREAVSSPNPDFTTLAQDIRGHALYSSLQEVFRHKAQRGQNQGKEPSGQALLEFDDGEIEWAIGLYQTYVRERVNAFELSFFRIMGVISALRPFCQQDPSGSSAPWWLSLPEHGASADGLGSFVESLRSIYTDARLDDFSQRVAEVDVGAIEGFLRSLPDIVNSHRANTPLPVVELREAAVAYVRSEFQTGPLACLGIGEEGVVLTDRQLVYKYFHRWNPRNRDCPSAFLQSLVGKLSGYKSLLDLREIRRDGDHVVAVYPYEAGAKYEGGHLEGLLTLLRECCQAGIACRNIHPDNLLVTPSGLKLIDYGADIVAATDEEFAQMCRRAFLTYRFPFRSDLKSLMARALTDAALPELTGLDRFLNALDPRGMDTLFYRPMAQLVSARRPASVLDYGCGDGRLAEEVSRSGITVTGYDPDPVSIDTCRQRRRPGEYGGRELLDQLLTTGTCFDVVVCSRVLCSITDDLELDNVLRDLRRLAADSGTAFIAVCNPFYVTAASTEMAQKHLPAEPKYADTFPYTKTLAVNGNRRTEVHRSYSAYQRAFAKAGLRIEEALEFDGSDTLFLQPASDHLVFRLSPAPAGGPRVSLLIKTCLMEWRTIDRLVRHQVAQLEGLAVFVEKVVVVDTFDGPFSRPYEQPDPGAHRAAMERLLRDGVVDRVIYAPRDTEAIRSTYLKWFGVESTETHSVNGQHLFATLFGFDSCTGDYVLQIDSDLLFVRRDKGHDFLGEMAGVLQRDSRALFVPMSICRSGPMPYTWESHLGDWRVEVRGCLFNRQRLQSVLPVFNELENGRFALGWHRSFDRFIASSDYRSYRGGDPRSAFIHVPNDLKTDVEGWLDIIGCVERGHVPDVQLERVDLTGSLTDWSGPKRKEPFVFVVCGRNVNPGRFRRCFESLVAQVGGNWGAVVVDDASTNGFGDYAEMLMDGFADRITLVRNERRLGALYNIWKAVTRFCVDPETVIITLDADDSLIGERVLERVGAEYDDGADVTVGSMLRLDKEGSYPVNFGEPRRWDSNVWQHLRTFKKRLFDAIAVEDLQIDGEWIDPANDWAFMVPIIEMSSSPRYIQDRLYLYEPSAPKDEGGRRERDSVIARILTKPRYSKLQK